MGCLIPSGILGQLILLAMTPFLGSCDRDTKHVKECTDGTFYSLGYFEKERSELQEDRDSPYFQQHFLPAVEAAKIFLKDQAGKAPPFHLFEATLVDATERYSILRINWLQDGESPEPVELLDEGGTLAKFDIPTADNPYLKTKGYFRMDPRVLLAVGQVATAEELRRHPPATLLREITKGSKLSLRVVRTGQKIDVARLPERKRPETQPDH